MVLCITGPNGSGKTTFIECLVGLLTPNHGTVQIQDMPVSQNLRQTKSQLGFVPDDEDWLIKELCAKEYLGLLAHTYRQAGVTSDMEKRIAELAELLGFSSFLEPLASLSHGNKKKVQLIAAFMHQPAVIVMDEVRNGLDPLAVIAVEQLIRQEAKRDALIIVTTHDLWWAERLSERTLVLANGAVTTYKKTAEIVAKYGSLEKFFLQTIRGAN